MPDEEEQKENVVASDPVEPSLETDISPLSETQIEEPGVAEPMIGEVEMKETEPVQIEQIQKEPEPEPPAEIEKIGNKTIERKGDKVTITEVMGTAQSESGTAHIPVFEPFKQKNLWQKFLQKVGLSKERKIAKILKLLENKQKITNDDIEKLLHISDATATRYLDQLEKSNQIRQIGKVGQSIYYEKV